MGRPSLSILRAVRPVFKDEDGDRCYARRERRKREPRMFRATADKPLATTITGSLPRPQWFVENLRGRAFLTAFHGDAVYREQYGDAVATLIADQLRAGLDIVTDGEMRFDQDIGGRSWFGYPFDRMAGLAPQSYGNPRQRQGFGGRT